MSGFCLTGSLSILLLRTPKSAESVVVPQKKVERPPANEDNLELHDISDDQQDYHAADIQEEVKEYLGARTPAREAQQAEQSTVNSPEPNRSSY